MTLLFADGAGFCGRQLAAVGRVSAVLLWPLPFHICSILVTPLS